MSAFGPPNASQFNPLTFLTKICAELGRAGWQLQPRHTM
jgi:hypothetical protein